jgi:hypothetical protein
VSGISKYPADELADAWEARAGTDPDAKARQILRECADTVRMVASVEVEPGRCPRAPEPFNYCPDCDGSFPCQLPGMSQQ